METGKETVKKSQRYTLREEHKVMMRKARQENSQIQRKKLRKTFSETDNKVSITPHTQETKQWKRP